MPSRPQPALAGAARLIRTCVIRSSGAWTRPGGRSTHDVVGAFCATHTPMMRRAWEGTRERLSNPARPAQPQPPTLRTSHFPNPPLPTLSTPHQDPLDTERRRSRRALGPLVPTHGPATYPPPVGQPRLPPRPGTGGLGPAHLDDRPSNARPTALTRTIESDRVLFAWSSATTRRCTATTSSNGTSAAAIPPSAPARQRGRARSSRRSAWFKRVARCCAAEPAASSRPREPRTPAAGGHRAAHRSRTHRPPHTFGTDMSIAAPRAGSTARQP